MFFNSIEPKEKTIDAIILNGVECEPYLTADHQLMLEKTEAMVTDRGAGEVIGRTLRLMAP